MSVCTKFIDAFHPLSQNAKNEVLPWLDLSGRAAMMIQTSCC